MFNSKTFNSRFQLSPLTAHSSPFQVLPMLPIPLPAFPANRQKQVPLRYTTYPSLQQVVDIPFYQHAILRYLHFLGPIYRHRLRTMRWMAEAKVLRLHWYIHSALLSPEHDRGAAITTFVVLPQMLQVYL